MDRYILEVPKGVMGVQDIWVNNNRDAGFGRKINRIQDNWKEI